MQQVADWLQKLGLGKYAQSFAENDISFSILPDLTDQDLKELGVASLGHRRQLLRATAELTGAAPRSSEPIAEATVALAPRDTAERRQVTVMFSDLVGSTALSARMDPEDLREVISAYQKCVAKTVQRSGGFVAKYMGDGVLIYFGYPKAQEDDAERAVRTGLDLVAAVSALKSHAPLQTRVGIATGLVVVGDLVGSGASQEQAIVGETPNLAARLQGVAQPNSIVIAESTRKLIGELFELADLGGQDLKGLPGSVRAWTALRASSVESRFEALHAGALTELVGREEELDLLLRRWSKAKAGQGQAVLLSGEAGIGKSRLTAALLERLATETHTRLRYFCSPQHTDSALYPIISQMERAAGFTHDENTQAKLDKLDALLARSFTPRQDAAHLAETLSLPNDGRYPTLEQDPQQRRQKTLEALTAQLEALAQTKPVLMIFEDAHWIDPTSLEAVGRAADRLKTLGVLLIVTYRPEFEPPWMGRPYVTALSLNRLDEREITAMIDRVAGNKALPESIRQDIIERTDGVPLFVEEMTKAVLEAESEGEAQRTTAAVPSQALAVPASLHASLMARLDRLGPAKEVAQIGSAIGREFSHALLKNVCRKDDTALRPALDRLTGAGLLFRQGVPPNASYLFKHALVQEAAYSTLLRERRRPLHARIAETLESEFTETASSRPELVARHYTEAGLIEKAASLWERAGQRSLERSALSEASEQLGRAVSQLEILPSSPATRRAKIRSQVAQLAALFHVKGFSAVETKHAVQKARFFIDEAAKVGEEPDDPLLLFLLVNGAWATHFTGFNGDVAFDLAKQLLALAEKRRDSILLTHANRAMAMTLLHRGEISEARPHFEGVQSLYDQSEQAPLLTRFGQDVYAAALSFFSFDLWALGYPASAEVEADRAVRHSRELKHAPSLMYALTVTIITRLMCGNYVAARTQSEELFAIAEEKQSIYWKAAGMVPCGCAKVLGGEAEAGVEMIEKGLSGLKAAAATVVVPLYLSILAIGYMALDKLDEAQRAIADGLALIESTKEKLSEAEVYRVFGELTLNRTKDAAKAKALFDRALLVARQQQAKSWELRASMSLARLWRDQGKVQEARELLAPVYGWFTEGFDTRDLREAKALLGELARS
jgi:class 3 adenylate cyclase/tetratricopeptide (TPR) repeat protein